MHVGLIALLLTGTGQRLLTAVSEPLKVALLEPPEQPPPPEPVPLPPAPQMELPPPIFVPPPEVRITQPKPPPQPVVRSTPERPVSPAPARAPALAVPGPPAAVAAPPKPAGPAIDLSRPARIVVAQCEPPTYPAAARRQEATGTSRIRFEVDARGQVVSAEVVERSGRSRAHQQLDKAAIDALSQCQFTPGRDKQGRPIGGHASVEYVWQIE